MFFKSNKVFFLFVERNIYLIFACQILRKMTHKYDFLVIGSGVAGMSYALKVAEANKGRIAIICKTTLEEANTTKAQGGIAAVTN